MNQVMHHRARIAALTRSRPADDPELRAEYAALAEERIAAFLTQTIIEVSPLTPSAAARLALQLLTMADLNSEENL